MDRRFFKGVNNLILKGMISFMLLVCMICSLASYSTAQGIKAWTNLNLYGGRIYDIAIDPCNPQRIFASSYKGDGLFMTTDDGNTWQRVETKHLVEGEDTFKNHAVYAVKIAPSNPNIVWVAHNHWVEKSIDGGLIWTHIRNSTMQRDCPNCGGEEDYFRLCSSLSIDPIDPNIVYVGTAGPLSTFESGAIYKTMDGGLTWKKLGFDASEEFDYEVTDIDIDPQDTNIIWAVTDSEGHGGWGGTLYRSADGGETWEEIFSLTPFGGAYTAVAVKPNDPNIVFTASGYGIIKHQYDGNQWQFIWPIIEDSRRAMDVTFDLENPEVLYTAWKNPFFGDHMPKVGRSIDGGINWEIYTVDYYFLSLAVHPANGEVILGGDSNLGVFKSDDHGKTWNPVNNGINAIIVYDVAIDPKDSIHILAGTISGVFEKKGDEEWYHLIPDTTHSIAFHPTDSKIFYAGIDGYIKKTMDGGAKWSLSNNFGEGPVFDIEIDPINNDTLFIAFNYNYIKGEIHKSIDGGDSFEKVLEGINLSGERYGFNTIAIDPSDTKRIFAGGGNFNAPEVNGDLWVSFDGGTNWTRTGLQNVIVNALLINPIDPNIMYAGCGYSGGTHIPLYKSQDGGKTWEPCYTGIPEISIPLADIWGASPTDVFVVGTNGAILHYNGIWSIMDSNSTENLKGIWGASTTDVFAVGTNGTILHYDGEWSAMDSNITEDLWGIWGTSPTDVFAAGANGTILHYNGSWSAMNSNTTEHLTNIWGTSSTDVFAVGTNSTILHYDGEWSAMDSNTTEYLSNIWGASPTDVFAVGDNGTIMHYDGKWSGMKSGTTINLRGVYGGSSKNLFAVGYDDTVLHYDGNTWSLMDLGIPRISKREDLIDIWGSSGLDIFVVGWSGSIIHYNGSTWSLSRPSSCWNAITDLEFHPQNRNVIYASTLAAGVYVSPNQGEYWLYLGNPEFDVHAIATSSLYAATEGGLWQCTGTGVVAGRVIDGILMSGISGATVFNDMGVKTICINGDYMMVCPSGICDITAIAEGYANKTQEDVTVYGGDISWVNFAMQSGISEFLSPEARSSGGRGRGVSCFIAAVTRFF